MESLRRRQYNRGPTANAQVQQSNAVVPTSPLVAVPIVETQIGVKNTTGPAALPTATAAATEKVPGADDYPDPGSSNIFINLGFQIHFVFHRVLCARGSTRS